jgi:acyl-CoA synthetase (AMP-forming)/AMP-acid ligase II
VRGPNVFPGYWRNPEATAAAFRDGWLLTGDVAECDDQGYYWLRGRIKEMIVSGGENVYPAEVEAALHEHPAVVEAAVVGVPDERWGERVAAVVEMRPDHNATLEELDEHVRTLIAGYKVPRELHLVDKIERSPSGKPDYRWAKDIATGVKSA